MACEKICGSDACEETAKTPVVPTPLSTCVNVCVTSDTGGGDGSTGDDSETLSAMASSLSSMETATEEINSTVSELNANFKWEGNAGAGTALTDVTDAIIDVVQNANNNTLIGIQNLQVSGGGNSGVVTKGAGMFDLYNLLVTSNEINTSCQTSLANIEALLKDVLNAINDSGSSGS